MNTPDKKTIPFNHQPSPKKASRGYSSVRSKLNFDLEDDALYIINDRESVPKKWQK